MGDDEDRGERRSAADDLAQGLGLMFRAARKAVANLDKEKFEKVSERVEETVESFGRRAAEASERIDREKVKDFGRKAAKNLDPRKIEELAEDAGKEFLNVVQKVASRVEDALGDLERRADPDAPGRSAGAREDCASDTSATSDAANAEAADPGDPSDADDAGSDESATGNGARASAGAGGGRPKVRLDPDD